MSNKTYFVTFGSGDPRTNTGLSPTFLIFVNQSGVTLAPPSISEVLSGSGFYSFAYAPTLAIAFLIDGATTGLGSVSRYIKGDLDPVQLVDQGVSTIQSAIGTNTDSFGTTLTDPTTVFGYARRHLEDLEGNMSYTKSSGLLQLLSRGSSTLLIQKQIQDSTSTTTKT